MARKTLSKKPSTKVKNKGSKLVRREKIPGRRPSDKPGDLVLYGRNSVKAALDNSRRIVKEIHGDVANDLKVNRHAALPHTEKRQSQVIAELDQKDLPHQGVALVVDPLPPVNLRDCIPGSGACAVLILDQVSDPQNIGAALRVAAALNVSCLITQEKYSPQESGSLARAAAGTLEIQPWVRVSNIARTIELLKEKGFWIAGMDGAADVSVSQVDLGDRYALVMGSEGRGLRPLVREHCDHLIKIPMASGVESLNVSVAAGIGLYALAQTGGK